MSGTFPIIPTILSIVVFVLFMVGLQIVGKKDTTRERLRRMTGEKTNTAGAADVLVNPMRDDEELSALGTLCDQILRIIGIDTEAFRKKSQLLFYRAGLESYSAPVYYLFFKRIGMVIFVILGLLIASSASEGPTKLLHCAIGLFFAVIGIFGADIFVKNQRTKREKILQRSFPDALDLLLVCVESGLALDGALARVCKELGHAHPEMTQELNRTRLELTLLNNRPQALTNLAERTDMMPFRSLSMTLLQSERFGTSLTDTLRVLSEDYRHTRLMIAEDKAGRLPVLMTIPLILFMMPALFIVILGPAILKLMHILHS